MPMENIKESYFQWLIFMVCDDYQRRFYNKLFQLLHSMEFTWTIDYDANRAADGIDLRSEFADFEGINYLEIRDILCGPCTVLEMLVALSKRCEDSIMGDSRYGDRTGKWFWEMIGNLGIDAYDDGRFERGECRKIVQNWLNRQYSETGKGGIFIVENPRENLQKVEIWYQLLWYLDEKM